MLMARSIVFATDVPPLVQCGQAGAERQRHHQQKADSENHPEGQEAGAHQTPQTGVPDPLRCPPYSIEGILKFGKDGRRANEEKDGPQHCGGHAFGRSAHGFKQAVHGRCPGGTQQAAQLTVDLAAGRVLAEGDSSDGNHDEQQGGD
jgi:hypothetical protein